jgi:hypothetical protein
MLCDASTEIAHFLTVDQLALAPVFLLAGIAGILNVMSSRLARIIDRGRRLTESPPGRIVLPPDKVVAELRTLERRRGLASAAITACTLSALFVCMVIANLFLEVLLQLRLKWLGRLLFTASTVSLLIGLTLFLREVHLGARTVRIEPAHAAAKPPDAP